MKRDINLFEGAKFGDWYMTSEGYKVRYVGNLGNLDIAIVIVPTTSCEKHVSVNGHLLCGSSLSDKQFVIGRCDADIDDDSQSYTKWNSMDKEPLICGVILYSKRENKIYDGSYIGNWYFFVNNLMVDKSNFDCWIQRDTFFKESGLRKFFDDTSAVRHNLNPKNI